MVQLQAITTTVPLDLLDDPSFLQPGAQVVARVAAAASAGDGRGLLSLAGFLIPARLPPELEAGTRLPLEVAARTAEALVLRVRGEGAQQPQEQSDGPGSTPLAGALAASGDGELLRAALVLSPSGAFRLPDGSAASVALEDDDGGDRSASVARVVVASPALGPVEIRLRLDDAGASAHVVVDPGAEPFARAAMPDLADRVSRTVQARCSVSLERRAAAAPPPALSLDFDAYA